VAAVGSRQLYNNNVTLRYSGQAVTTRCPLATLNFCDIIFYAETRPAIYYVECS